MNDHRYSLFKKIVIIFSIFMSVTITSPHFAFAKAKLWKIPLRGVTGNLNLNEADLKNLAESWGANSIRLMLMNGDVRAPEPPYTIEESKLQKIDQFLDWCEKYNLRCIIDVHETPGRVEWRGKKDRRLWEEYRFHDILNETWDKLAERYKNRGDVIAGYDLFNEPNMDKQVPDTPSDWNALAKRLTTTIRNHDKMHVIIVEPIQWGSASGFSKLQPTGDSQTIYSFHFYVPHQFTHQGVYEDVEPVSYPGMINGKMWNKIQLEKEMQPAIDFQQRTGCELYVGEFSAIRWAPGKSGLNYLTDVISIFENQGWSWSYHAYREWAGWSLEHEGPKSATRGPLKMTPRLALLESYWKKTNEPASNANSYRLNPIPSSLEKVRGIHPRIYLRKARIQELRKAIKTTHASLWEEVRDIADRAVRRGAPKYIEDDGHSGEEQLWQRNVGNTMPYLAMAYVLSGDKKYLDSAREWALASCAYKTWGLGRIDGMDLAAGHQLFGLGIIYDWCYDDLDQETRKIIRDTLVRRTSAMYEAAATGKVWWRRSYMQNHLWVNICGMSVAGMALFDEIDKAIEWIGLPLDKFQKTMKALGEDGASHEGVGYWEYGVEYMLKFMQLARERLDVNMYDNDWWRNTANYRLYLSLPRNAWTQRNNIVDIADCPRGNWYGPDYLLRRLASEYQDSHAQWLAEQIDTSNVDSPESRWLNLIWYDPSLKSFSPDNLPPLHHFDDMDIVSMRSGWSGNESLVVFKCGPFIGHKGIQDFTYDPGGGHVHPDANHFVLFGGGEWLIRDDGYRAKWTKQHNTLVIDGKGQLGEGRMWFNGSEPLRLKANPRIIKVESSPKLDHIAGDATEAYPKELGINHYVRHLLFLKPNILIVVDDIALENPKSMELLFHPESEQWEASKDGFLIKGKQTALNIDILTPESVDFSAGKQEVSSREGENNQTMFAVTLKTNQAQWRNAVAFCWCKSGSKPIPVTLQKNTDNWQFSAGDSKISFNWKNGEAKIIP